MTERDVLERIEEYANGRYMHGLAVGIQSAAAAVGTGNAAAYGEVAGVVGHRDRPRLRNKEKRI